MGGGVIVLGIETSTSLTSIALASETGPIASESLSGGRGHVEFLVPAILRMSEGSGIGLRELEGVAVGIGPGLFTGMRVGIATAKTLARFLGVPIAGIGSLDALAHAVRHSPRLICVCVDARRGEVFSALYRRSPGGLQRIEDERVSRADSLATELRARGEDVLFVGTGAVAYGEALAHVERAEFASPALQFPLAEHVAELAVPAIARGDLPDVARLEPRYVRKSDAEIKWEERGVVIERPFRVKPASKAVG